MILPIRIYGDPILREQLPLVASHKEVLPVIQDIIETMYDDDGIGLSANQTGYHYRFFVIGENAFQNGRPDSVFINPELLEVSEDVWDYEEGCLSVPGIREKVYRPRTIRVRYTDAGGKEQEEELSDLAGRVFQHELDHLNGIFFVDRISPIRRTLIRKKLKQLSNSHS